MELNHTRDLPVAVAFLAVAVAFLVLFEDTAFAVWRGTVIQPFVKAGLASLGAAGVFGFAALAGALSAVSPSAYPFLPPLADYAARAAHGGSIRDRLRLAVRTGLGAFGLSLAVGLVAAGLGSATPLSVLKPVAAAFLVLAGVTLVSRRGLQVLVDRLPDGVADGGVAYGVCYGVVCLPCKVAVVGALSAYVAATGNLAIGAAGLAVYAAVFGLTALVATLLAASGGGRLRRVAGAGRYVRLSSGVVVIASGLWMLKLFAETGM